MNTADVTKNAFRVSLSCDFTVNEACFKDPCRVLFVSSDRQYERHDNDF